MGNKSSSPYPPPPPRGYQYHFDPRLRPPPPPPGAIDEGWAIHHRRTVPIQRGPGWAGSRMSLSGGPIGSYPPEPHEQMLVLPPDPKLLKKIHKEQKKLLKKMRGLPVEVIVAPVGTGGRLPPPPPPPHPGMQDPRSFAASRAYSIDNLTRDAIYTDGMPRRPVSSHNSRWGSTGPSATTGSSIDSPITSSSAGSHTIDHPPWMEMGRVPPPPRPATNLNRSETDRQEWARRRHVIHTTHHRVEERNETDRLARSPPSHPATSLLARAQRDRPRSAWLEATKRAHSTSALHSSGSMGDVMRQPMEERRQQRMDEAEARRKSVEGGRERDGARSSEPRSGWSSASSDRLGGSTGDIDFSWVREEEGRLKAKSAGGPRGDGLPECYFGREQDCGRGETNKSRDAHHDPHATLSMAF